MENKELLKWVTERMLTLQNEKDIIVADNEVKLHRKINKGGKFSAYKEVYAYLNSH